MKARALLIISILLLLSLSATAVEQLDEHNFELEYQDTVTLELQEFSFVRVRTPERSTIVIKLEDTEVRFIVDKIDDEGNVVLASQEKLSSGLRDGKFDLELGADAYQFELRESRFPVIFIENEVFHASDKVEDQNVVIRITVPLLKQFNPDGEVIGEEENIIPEVTGQATTETEEPGARGKDPYLKYFLGIIILLLIIIVVLGPKNKGKKVEEEKNEAPAEERTAENKEPQEDKKTAKKKATKKKEE